MRETLPIGVSLWCMFSLGHRGTVDFSPQETRGFVSCWIPRTDLFVSTSLIISAIVTINRPTSLHSGGPPTPYESRIRNTFLWARCRTATRSHEYSSDVPQRPMRFPKSYITSARRYRCAGIGITHAKTHSVRNANRAAGVGKRCSSVGLAAIAPVNHLSHANCWRRFTSPTPTWRRVPLPLVP